jgi:hypothetical protein
MLESFLIIAAIAAVIIGYGVILARKENRESRHDT